MIETYRRLTNALEAAIAMSNRVETDVWVAHDKTGYVVCVYADFPEGGEIVCTVNGAAALHKLWNTPIPKWRTW